jgi:integrase/recombinase XerD
MNHLPENHSGATSDAHLIELWLAGRPESTQGVYRPVADEFLGFLGKSLQEATVADVVRWSEMLPGSEATRSRKVSTLKSLLSYAHRTGYTLFNVGLPLRVPRPRNKLHERILEPAGVHAIIREATTGRDQILVRFLYASGARIAEVVQLRFQDIRGNRVTLNGKGRKTRTVIVPGPIAEELRSLRGARDLDTSFIFRSFRGRQLDVRNARQIVSDAAGDAGFDVSPHWFRHAHASHALDNGAPIHLVAAGLGHANIATTSQYLHARPNDGASRFLEIPL